MMDPFKQHSNVTTAYFGSGKINAVTPALLRYDRRSCDSNYSRLKQCNAMSNELSQVQRSSC